MFNFRSTSTEEYDWDWDVEEENMDYRVRKLERKLEVLTDDIIPQYKERIKALENYLGIEFKDAPEIGSYEEIENDN